MTNSSGISVTSILLTAVIASAASAAVAAATVRMSARNHSAPAAGPSKKRGVKFDKKKQKKAAAAASSESEAEGEEDSDSDSDSDKEKDSDEEDPQDYDGLYNQDFDGEQYEYGERGLSQQSEVAGIYDADLDEAEDEDADGKPKPDATDKPVAAHKLRYRTVEEMWAPNEYRWVVIRKRPTLESERTLAFMAHRRVVAGNTGESVTKVHLRVLSQPLIKVLQVTVDNDEKLYEKVPFVAVPNIYSAKARIVAWVTAAKAAKEAGEDAHVAGLAAVAKVVEIEQPGSPVRRHSHMQTVHPEEVDVAIRTVDLLLEYLSVELADTVAQYDALLHDNMMTYDLLWMYIRSGQYLAYRHPIYKMDCIMRCVKTRYVVAAGDEPPYFLVQGETVEWSGTRMFKNTVKRAVPAYSGAREVAELPLAPLSLMSETVRTELIERGKKYERLSGFQYKAYNGPMWIRDGCQVMALAVEGRVCIDRAQMAKMNPNWPLATPQTWSLNNNGMNDAEAAMAVGSLLTLTDTDYLIMPPIVYGFSLSRKIWGEMLVSQVEEIEFVEEAFDLLVLPEETKQLVSGLVNAHDSKHMVGDMIKGKGQGLIFLLHSRPGLGKTLTAEAISEKLRRPLYSVGVGELGTDPASLEFSLQRVLDLAEAWNAVLLLDEADVFLEKRSSSELTRSGMVAVFLRLLEYYSGLLFLTTNRVATFDAALHSRISVALRYPSLDANARREVWTQVLDRIAASESANATTAHLPAPSTEWRAAINLDVLSGYKLNGRRIKTIMRTAHAVALDRGTPVTMKDILMVLGISEDFHKNLAQSNLELEADDEDNEDLIVSR
ncbi:hypothetical protein BC828DRAFT_404490 [Blastocladiella britannica]|nr:hypothetical protein BC828DRAFT_404490 [Blastocladiella britannica]